MIQYEWKTGLIWGHGERNYAEMVAHFKDYNDIVGDHPQNMGATTLAANAFMLTGEAKIQAMVVGIC